MKSDKFEMTQEEHDQLRGLLKKLLTTMAHNEIASCDIDVKWDNGNEINCELSIVSILKDGEKLYV